MTSNKNSGLECNFNFLFGLDGTATRLEISYNLVLIINTLPLELCRDVSIVFNDYMISLVLS